MALPVRKGYKGAPAQAVLTNSPTNSDTSFVVDTVVGWAATFPFYCVVEPGTSREEKVKVTAISGSTLTVVRGQDDTSAQGHTSGSSIYPVFTADEADEANLVASAMTTKGDLISTDGSTINRVGVGANSLVLQADSALSNGIKWGQVAEAGIADGSITLAKLAASLQAYLVPVGTINAYAGVTAPTGWLLCNGTSTTGYTALAALVGATTPDMQGRFPIGDNGTLTLLGTGGSTTIAEGNLPSHTHTFSGTSDGMNQNSTPGHTVVDPGHNHTQNPHNHTQDPHGHTINDHTHTNQVTFISPAGSHAHDNIANYVAAGTNAAPTSPSVASISTTSLSANSNTATNQANTASNNSNTTGVSVNAHNIAHTHTYSGTTNGGTGAGTAYYQPYLVVNYIIKHD